jgi:hypothetical protein
MPLPKQDTTKHGVTVRVYTPPGKAEEGRFSLMVATEALDLYDDFFAIPYPLPKLDMVRACLPACLPAVEERTKEREGRACILLMQPQHYQHA